MVKLFVGGFPLNWSEMDLARLVGPYGDISTIKIVRDRKTKTCKGYAFIEMVDEQAATVVVEALNGRPIEDRELTINITEEKPATKPANQNRRPTSSSYLKAYKGAPESRPKRPRKPL